MASRCASNISAVSTGSLSCLIGCDRTRRRRARELSSLPGWYRQTLSGAAGTLGDLSKLGFQLVGHALRVIDEMMSREQKCNAHAESCRGMPVAAENLEQELPILATIGSQDTLFDDGAQGGGRHPSERVLGLRRLLGSRCPVRERVPTAIEVAGGRIEG